MMPKIHRFLRWKTFGFDGFFSDPEDSLINPAALDTEESDIAVNIYAL